MDLLPKQRKDLHEALLSAFPTHDALDGLLLSAISASPDEVTSESALSTRVYEVITWVESRGGLRTFLLAALGKNPCNPKLQAIATELEIPLPAEPCDGPGESRRKLRTIAVASLIILVSLAIATVTLPRLGHSVGPGPEKPRVPVGEATNTTIENQAGGTAAGEASIEDVSNISDAPTAEVVTPVETPSTLIVTAGMVHEPWEGKLTIDALGYITSTQQIDILVRNTDATHDTVITRVIVDFIRYEISSGNIEISGEYEATQVEEEVFHASMAFGVDRGSVARFLIKLPRPSVFGAYVTLVYDGTERVCGELSHYNSELSSPQGCVSK